MFSLLVSTLLLSTTGGASFDPEAPPELAFRYARTGQPMVQVRLDGVDAGWFVFDTGSAGHVIDRRLSRQLDLDVVGEIVSKNPTGSVHVNAVGSGRLTLGPATFLGASFAELDLAYLREVTDEDVAGIIGYDVFERCVIEVDYRGGRIALYDPETFDGEGLPWSALTVHESMPCVEASFEGHREVFLLDTGSDGGALFFTPTVQRLNLLAGRKTRSSRSSNVGGSLSYRRGRLEWFELAGRRWTATDAQFSITDEGVHALRFPAGIIGCIYLEGFRVFLDCRERRVALVAHEKPAVPDVVLDGYAGFYQPSKGGVYEFRRRGERLYTPRVDDSKMWLDPESETTFHAEDSLLRFEFVKNLKGQVTHVLITHPGREPELARRKDNVRLRKR